MIHWPEIVFLAGFVSLATGLWMAWPPLCMIVLGIVFIFIGTMGAAKWGSSRRS